ncbi:MAG TPA: patatin-like phospholipase family protein [Acidiferrobacterales bacterium]|nr:patatin-like phospholipase family protein [Acidiferrobacterales bacterium]
MKMTLSVCWIGILLAGCGTVPRQEAPPSLFGAATPVGFPSTVRSLAVDRRYYAARAHEAQRRVRAAAAGGTINILALSGGGAGGAFGAGALVGLSRRRERPQFEIVTGVSAGAIIAPFAFLGPAWDAQLIEAYLGGRLEHLLRLRGVGVLFSPGLYQLEPLTELVDHFVTDEVIQAVAHEAAKGRLLLVATTDLDKEETVIWDMGAIAAHGGKAARTLFRDVLVASASISGVFPPVMIHVEDAGTSYDEMHVDGGATVPFFIMPGFFNILPSEPDGLKGANVYVLINTQLGESPRTTPVEPIPVIARSFSATLKHMSRETLGLTAAFAQRQGMSLRFSEIPVDYPFQGPLDFHASNLQALFNYAAECAFEGRLWTTIDQALNRGERAALDRASKAQRQVPGQTVKCPLDEPPNPVQPK